MIRVISDEVAIKKSIEYNRHERKFTGFVTCENAEDANNEKPLAVAKDALVFMAVSDDFKIPVAYFLVTGLKAYERAAITGHVVCRINATGAEVVSLTGDGLIANIKVTKILGANYDQNQSYFISSSNPCRKIFCIWDPPHMLKLLRGCFGKHKIYHNNELIDWSLIAELRNFNLGNKLTELHLNFHLKPMNVKSAAA